MEMIKFSWLRDSVVGKIGLLNHSLELSCKKFLMELVSGFSRKFNSTRILGWTHSSDRVQGQPENNCVLILSSVINDNHTLITTCTQIDFQRCNNEI
jgi:hypothetical protein